MKNDLTRGMVRPKEKRLIDSAISIIAVKGFAKSTLSDVSRNTGIPRATIFYYFKDLESLQLAALRSVHEEYQAYITVCLKDVAVPSARTLFEKYFDGAVQWPALHPQSFAAWISFLHHCTVNKDFSDFNKDVVAITYQQLKLILDDGLHQNVFQCDTESAARLIQLLLCGLTLAEATDGAAPERREEVKAFCMKILGVQPGAQSNPERPATSS